MPRGTPGLIPSPFVEMAGIRDGQLLKFQLHDLGRIRCRDTSGNAYEVFLSKFYEGTKFLGKSETEISAVRANPNARIYKDTAFLESIGITDPDPVTWRPR